MVWRNEGWRRWEPAWRGIHQVRGRQRPSFVHPKSPFHVAGPARLAVTGPRAATGQSKSDVIQASPWVRPRRSQEQPVSFVFVLSHSTMSRLVLPGHSSIAIRPLHPHWRIPARTIRRISLRARRSRCPATEQPLREILREDDRIALFLVHRTCVADRLEDAYLGWIDEDGV